MVDIDPALPAVIQGHCARRDKSPVIWVAPGPTSHATDFRVGHEVGHFHLEDEFRGSLLERVAQRFSAAFLVPPHPFVEAVGDLGVNPFALQSYWTNVSVETLATRVTELFPNFIATYWQGGRRVWMRASYKLTDPLFFNVVEGWVVGESFGPGIGYGEVKQYGMVSRAWRTGVFPNSAITLTELLRK
jgi:hypothetical protein